jgi:hypothetical protein
VPTGWPPEAPNLEAEAEAAAEEERRRAEQERIAEQERREYQDLDDKYFEDGG